MERRALGVISFRVPLAMAATALAFGTLGCASAPGSAREPRVYLRQVAEIDTIFWRGSGGFEYANRATAPEPVWYAATPEQVSAAFGEAYRKREPTSVPLGHRLDAAAAEAVIAMQQEKTSPARSQLAARNMCHNLGAQLLAVAYLATLTCRSSASPDGSMVEVMLAY